tara:strand:- start:1120 stop:1401 length:282 start_codon:yes stop_codon:yes gene_type:complete
MKTIYGETACTALSALSRKSRRGENTPLPVPALLLGKADRAAVRALGHEAEFAVLLRRAHWLLASHASVNKREQWTTTAVLAEPLDLAVLTVD